MEISTNNNPTGQLDQNQPTVALSNSEPDKQIQKQNIREIKPDAAAKEQPKKESSSGEDIGTLMEMYEESFKRFAEGEVVTGRIISVDKEHVLVDIGYKSEGQIRINEFRDEKGVIHAEAGDAVEVMVEWWDDKMRSWFFQRKRPPKLRFGMK